MAPNQMAASKINHGRRDPIAWFKNVCTAIMEEATFPEAEE
jgi:hypothetical protein